MGLTGWRLLSLIGAALIGGYVLATAAGIFLGGVLPTTLGEAVLTGNLLCFAVYAGAIIWAFTVRRPGLVWLGLLLFSALLTISGLTLRGHPL